MESTDSRKHEKYRSIIEEYIMSKCEFSLYEAQQFSRELIKQNMSPEEMINIHISVIRELFPDLPPELLNTHDFLLEVMVGYGLAYREHQSLRSRQRQLASEFAVAAKMQQELLPKILPTNPAIEIGFKSVAAASVSGDYYHFAEDEQGMISVAVADVIGKGLPAALCMSMIKYAIDSMPEKHGKPRILLESLNRVVEQNISSNMFITMIYGTYDSKMHKFCYSSAGHEPGFIYRSQKDEFEDLSAKGLVLGITKHSSCQEYEINIEKNDLIILLSDGVTECRTENGFLERNEIPKLIKRSLHLPVQEIVNNVYKELEKLQNFQLQDDFTLMIIRRNV